MAPAIRDGKSTASRPCAESVLLLPGPTEMAPATAFVALSPKYSGQTDF